MENVYYYKLVDGSEFIAQCTGESSESIKVKNPVSLIINYDHNGNMQVGMMPYPNPFVKSNEFYIDRENFIFESIDIDDKLKTEYSNQFSSIITPDTSLRTQSIQLHEKGH